MNTNKLLFAFALFSLVALRASSQATYSQPRINAAVDNTKLTVLRGNTYPLARPQYDRGPAAAALPMQHMLLLLKRSPAQEAALESFMAQQMDASSPNYHHWLTPQEFGQQYGPAQQDIDAITKWLNASGFQVNSVSAGRTTIDFSGNAAQVQGAFHTAIHQYVIKGEQHWANASDPSIPTALVPVVAGVRSLHNFYPKPQVQLRRPSSSSRSANFTFNNGSPCDVASSSNSCFAVGPNDFATIYNVQPLWNNGIDGTGETIAIVADSNINPSDVSQFRSLFGLPNNVPNVILTNTNPGLNSDEIEAALDTEWTGAVAKNATIDLVVSSNTNTTAGIDLSAEYVINNNIASVLSSSFGACEYALGTAGNQFYNTEYQQAQAEGITVVVSSGDAGATSCDVPIPDNPPGCGFSSSTLLQTAQCGVAVNGLASTPFNIAVGGTDFNDIGNQTLYWSTANSAGQASAMKYIPEDVWNDSCTNSQLFDLVTVNPPITTPVGSCSDLTIQQNDLVSVVGGGGGESNCTNGATTVAGCSGGNPQPAWQTTAGVPGTTRDLPDLSLFAGDGLYGQFYIMCEMDSSASSGGQGGSACALGASPIFTGVGGTSASVQAFAGIMALVDQKHSARQGNAASVLYPLAATQSNSSCNSSAPASTCIFNDISVGTNAMPCTPGTVDCSTTASIPGVFGGPAARMAIRAMPAGCVLAIGLLLLLGLRQKQRKWTIATATAALALLVVSVGCGGGGNGSGTVTNDNGTPEGISSGYSAGTGYDLATGLGSVNAQNFVDSTLWAGVPPSTPPATVNRPIITLPVATLAMALAMLLGLLFMGLRRKQLRWTTAVLLVAFALSILSAARASANTRPAHRAVARHSAPVRFASLLESQR
ncbi:MAG TPA: S53 family peptidase [Candidatus Acidoferrales bacterium]|jgi:hypothetical protein|nr:S53 family peptidase [Candidatus Acidoferrales bacterium]